MAHIPGRRRAPGWSGVAASTLLATAWLAACGGDSASDQDTRPADPATIVLRLSDVGPGYLIGDDAGCNDPLYLEEYQGKLNEVLAEHPSAACYQQLEYYATTRPPAVAPLVESVALVSDSVEGARAIFAERATLLWYEGGVKDIDEERAPQRLGDETFLIDAKDKPVTGPAASVVTWRSGRVVNFVLVAGMEPAENARLAWEYAQRQQEYIDVPVPLVPADTDDREAPLDRPDLGVPVYWVGREFDPGGGLPAARIARSHAAGTPMGPGNRVDIEYDLRDTPGAGFRLMLWAPTEWEAFLEGEIGKAVMPARCVEKETIDIPAGRLELWRVATSTPSADCPDSYDKVFGIVFLEGAVVTINQPISVEFWLPPGPYNSVEGVEAVARALVAR